MADQNNGSGAVAIVAIVVIVAIVAALGYFFFYHAPATDGATPSTTIINTDAAKEVVKR